MLRRSGPAVLAAALAACSAAPAARAESAWTPTSAMSTAREGHTATLLLDGRVLIAGGYGTQVEATAEIYDPVTLAFSPTGSMAAARVNHFAVRLADGKVLVAGGDDLASTEVYDPAAGKWAAAPLLSVPRTRAAGALLPGGKVLLAGGDAAAAGTAEIYDPAAGTWTPVAAPLLTPRRWHTATALPDGRVLLAGGATPKGKSEVATAEVEIYDPAAGAWTAAAPLPQACAQHTATALAGGGVLVAGGTAVPGTDSLTELGATAVYDPASGTWQVHAPLGTARAAHAAALLPSGAVLVTGGLDASNSALRSAELFDPHDLAAPWVALPPMTRDRTAPTATTLGDGSVLVAGGEQQSSAELFKNGQVGDPCTVGLSCEEGHCADGVCCATACDLPCRSCALPGATGTCTEAPAGTDPRGDCGDGGACDPTCGGGACTSRVGTACTPGGCTPDGQGELAAAVCAEGNRDCPIAPVACTGGYRCDADAGACRTDCLSLADCAPGYACNPSHACGKAAGVAAGAPSCAQPGALQAGAGGAAALAGAVLLGMGRRRRARRGTA